MGFLVFGNQYLLIARCSSTEALGKSEYQDDVSIVSRSGKPDVSMIQVNTLIGCSVEKSNGADNLFPIDQISSSGLGLCGRQSLNVKWGLVGEIRKLPGYLGSFTAEDCRLSGVL